MSIRQEIVDACAWMLWANAWVSLQEDEDREVADRVNPGAGGSWDPYVPDVPANVTEGAIKLIASIERMNDAPIDRLYERACKLIDGLDDHVRRRRPEPTPERFGNCIAYVAVGAGVSWSDDYPEPGIVVSEIEVVADSDTEAYVGNVCERFNRTM